MILYQDYQKQNREESHEGNQRNGIVDDAVGPAGEIGKRLYEVAPSANGDEFDTLPMESSNGKAANQSTTNTIARYVARSAHSRNREEGKLSGPRRCSMMSTKAKIRRST